MIILDILDQMEINYTFFKRRARIGDCHMGLALSDRTFQKPAVFMPPFDRLQKAYSGFALMLLLESETDNHCCSVMSV